MIVTFSVQNFRSIRQEICLDFRATSDKTLEDYYVYELPKPKTRILKMAMLYGANASGKTNILLALEFLRSFVLRTNLEKEDAIPLEPFALDTEELSHFRIEFCHDSVLYEYTLKLNRKAILLERLIHYPYGKPALVFERKLSSTENDYEYSYDWRGAEFRNKEQKNKLEILLHNQSILSGIGGFRYSGPIQEARNWFRETLAPIVKPRTSLMSYNINNYLSNMKSDLDYLSFFVERLQRADFMISSLEVKEREITFKDIPIEVRNLISKREGKKSDSDTVKAISLLSTHKTPEDSFVLDFDEESAGTKRYFEFIGLMCELLHKNRIVPIDEIECSMHIELQLHFIETFLRNVKGGQLLFTSHNTALLNERDILRRDAIWITERNPDGSTKLTSVSDYPVRKEHAIDRLYRKGFLGGIPNVGSTVMEHGDEYKKKE